MEWFLHYRNFRVNLFGHDPRDPRNPKMNSALAPYPIKNSDVHKWTSEVFIRHQTNTPLTFRSTRSH